MWCNMSYLKLLCVEMKEVMINQMIMITKSSKVKIL